MTNKVQTVCTEQEPAHDNAENPQWQSENTGNKLCIFSTFCHPLSMTQTLTAPLLCSQFCFQDLIVVSCMLKGIFLWVKNKYFTLQKRGAKPTVAWGLEISQNVLIYVHHDSQLHMRKK
jgi:hypothetical protein